jgi:hypothetical protein
MSDDTKLSSAHVYSPANLSSQIPRLDAPAAVCEIELGLMENCHHQCEILIMLLTVLGNYWAEG